MTICFSGKIEEVARVAAGARCFKDLYEVDVEEYFTKVYIKGTKEDVEAMQEHVTILYPEMNLVYKK